MKHSDKKNEILDCAQALIQKRGYNGFSYADISSVVNIRKASIHHHFPTKAELAVAVIERYRDAFNACLLTINAQHDWINKIDQYAQLYKQVLQEDKLCLCGMLASDADTLPDEVTTVIRDFFIENADWLSEILTASHLNLPHERRTNIAWQIINLLQGGVIMARILQNMSVFTSSYEEMMRQLKQLSCHSIIQTS